MILLEWWCKFVLKRWQKRREKPPAFAGFNSIKKALLVFDYSIENEREVLSYCKKLGEKGIVVNALGIHPQKRKKLNDTSKVHLLCKDEVGFCGQPKQQVRTVFLEKDYQLFVQLSVTKPKITRFLESMVSANFSTTWKAQGYLDFNLIVEQKEPSLRTYFEELDYYLNFINKTNDESA